VYYHLQVPASDCTEVPSRAVRASHNHRQSSSLAVSCSWRPIQVLATRTVTFGTPQFRCEYL